MARPGAGARAARYGTGRATSNAGSTGLVKFRGVLSASAAPTANAGCDRGAGAGDAADYRDARRVSTSPGRITGFDHGAARAGEFLRSAGRRGGSAESATAFQAAGSAELAA